MKYPLWLLKAELKHWWRHKGWLRRLNEPKSPIGQYNTILTFNFGFDNYTFDDKKFKRKHGK